MEQLETGSFASSAETHVPGGTIRVISWNMNRGQQLDGVLDFLRRTPADLVLLQEADVNARRTQCRHVAREIAQALGMHYVFGYEFQELTQGTRNSPAYHGQASLSRFPLSDSRVLRLRAQSGFWRPRWFVPNSHHFQRRRGGRIALGSTLTWLDKPAVVYNVHLESRGNDDLRCAQLCEVLDDLRQYGSEMPAIIAGDFNFDLSLEPAASILAGARFYIPYFNGSLRPTMKSSRLGRPRTIDWILSRGFFGSTAAKLHDSVSASDHYPLSLVLNSNRSRRNLDPRFSAEAAAAIR